LSFESVFFFFFLNFFFIELSSPYFFIFPGQRENTR
jgi:hypothetical protein